MSSTEFKLRGLLARFDPLTLTVGIVSFAVYALHGFAGVLTRDLAIYSYAGQQVVNGVPPYEGVLNRAGPLAHLIPAIGVLGARLGGFDDLLGMRLLFLAISVACVCLVYRLGRQLFESPLGGLAVAAAFLSFHGFIEYASYGPREKTPMVLFLLLTLLNVARQRWFAAGVYVGLATLTWQPVFFVGSAAVVVALAAQPSAAVFRGLVRFAAGGLIPTTICVCYFAMVGALSEFVEAFLLINAKYTTAGSLSYHFAHKWNSLELGYGISLWVIFVGLAVLVLVAALAVGRAYKRREPRAASMVAVGAAGLAGLAWCFRDFDLWPDAFVVLPQAAAGIGALSTMLVDRISSRKGAALALAWVVAGVSIASTYSVGERDYTLVRQRHLIAAMLKPLEPDVSILSIEAPHPLVLAGKTNPSRYQMFSRDLIDYMNDTYPGGIKGYGEWVGRERPTLIAVGGVFDQRPPWLANTLRAKYRRVGHAPGWTLYADRSLGSRLIRQLRDATGRPAPG